MVKSKKQIIIDTLRSFNAEVDTIQEHEGNTLTLYEIKPSPGTRVTRIRNLKDEIAAALGAPSVRIVAPLPNGLIGIEVPNTERKIITADEMLSSLEYCNSDAELPLALGQTVGGDAFVADLASMPHLLVAGATGQGKSVALNMMLLSLLQKKTPEQLRLILIDPKQVELSTYAPLANSYLEGGIVTSPEGAQDILGQMCNLMDARYDILNASGVRNIQEYNALSDNIVMPYYVVIIDEYGDLIMQSGREMERLICRLAQKARAVGIHLIVSTQRPSATIVTGNIKANFPTRIALRTTTGTDSRVIIDQTGAEKLTGKGDMLYFGGASVTRLQCAYADGQKIADTCQQLAEQYQPPVPQPSPPSPTKKLTPEEYRTVFEDTLQKLRKRKSMLYQRTATIPFYDYSRKAKERLEAMRPPRSKIHRLIQNSPILIPIALISFALMLGVLVNPVLLLLIVFPILLFL